MKRFYYLLLICFIVLNKSNAQELKSCATHDHFDQKIKSDSDLRLSYQKLQDKINAYLSENIKDQDGDTLIVPVVFQIIHNGDPLGMQENIAEDLILAQLQQINDDFSRMNTDAVNTPDAFLSSAANTQIQFCLAQVDPTGLTTSGIVRTHVDDLPNVSESDCWTPSYIDANIVTPLIWDRDSYLNIFSVIGVDEFDSGACNFFATLGYAQFPGGNANTDAAIVSFYTFGSLSTPNPLFPQFLGRTCTHEVGHWLNLNHVWGGGNGGCTQDDGIVDTPAQFEESNGCPSFPLYDNCTSSGNGVMYMNFMDYSDDDCMNLFTAGQRGMMRASIFNARTSLLTSPCETETVLSIPLFINLYIENIDNGIMLNWQMESDNAVNTFTIKKGKALDDLYNLDIINNCGANNNVYNCTYLDKENDAVNFYQIEAELENGETITSDIEVVKTDFKFSMIAIQPNPAADKIVVVNLNESQLYHISIFNNLGQFLFYKSTDGNLQNTIDINHFEQGIYYIKIAAEQKSTLIKFVKI